MLETIIQQAEIVSLPSWAMAAIVGVIMLILGTFITRFTKHSEVTISGPVEIRVLQENDKRLEAQMNKGFDELKAMFEAAEVRTHEWKNQILDRLGSMVVNQEKLGWRLDNVEKELTDIREKKIAALELELKNLSLTAEKIESIERELRSLNGKKFGGERSSI